MKDKKTQFIHLRLTEAERKNIDRLAVQTGRKLSVLIRDLINQALNANETGVVR